MGPWLHFDSATWLVWLALSEAVLGAHRSVGGPPAPPSTVPEMARDLGLQKSVS